ncbi:MAG: AI-2E family transporter [Atopobium sp.]|nr:AI-2E family transporter [Atopobium sp.]
MDQKHQNFSDSAQKWKQRGLMVWTVIGLTALFALALYVLGILGQAVELLAIGAIVAFVCSPVTNWLEDRGVPRGISALIALVLTLIVLVGFLILIAQPLVFELTTLLRNAPSYASQIGAMAREFWQSFDTQSNPAVRQTVELAIEQASSIGISVASGILSWLSTSALGNISSMANQLMVFFLGLVLAYWLAKDYPVIVREMAIIAGPQKENEFRLILAILSRSTSGYMRGTIITSAVNGILVYFGCLILGNPYAALIGMVTGIFHIIPVVGPVFSAGIALILSILVDPVMTVWTIVILVVAQNVVDNVLSPLVMATSVKVHPGLSLVGIVIGSALGGVVGTILAIPLTAALRGIFVYFFEKYSGRQIVSPNGALFNSTQYVDESGAILPEYDALDDPKFFEESRLVDQDTTAHVRSKSSAPAPKILGHDFSQLLFRNTQEVTKEPDKPSSDAVDSDSTKE